MTLGQPMRMDQAYRAGTTAILALMFFLSVGMLFGLLTFGWDAPSGTNGRFLLVASTPLVCLAIVLAARRKQVAPSIQLAFIALAFVAFIAAIDFANNRQPFSGLGIFFES